VYVREKKESTDRIVWWWISLLSDAAVTRLDSAEEARLGDRRAASATVE
jgi:hypothetical protein